METKVRKQGEYVTVVYQYQGDSLIINTGWKVPSAYWCSESEVSTSYPHYDAILQDVMESMSHLKYLATMSVGIFGEPTVENIRKLVSENKGLLSYDFFDQFHKYLSEHFDLSQEQFSELINLRELLIEFELFTMTPVNEGRVFELAVLHQEIPRARCRYVYVYAGRCSEIHGKYFLNFPAIPKKKVYILYLVGIKQNKILYKVFLYRIFAYYKE
jgi:predicted DNA-binding ArsR family transcriptional regulator